MVTLAESIQRISGEVSIAERSLSSQEQDVETASFKLSSQEKQFLQQTQPEPLTIKRQFFLSKAVGAGGVQQAFKGVRKAKKKARVETLPKISTAREEIKMARELIAGERAKLEPIKTELIKASAFERGRKAAMSSNPAAVFGLSGRQERRGFRAGVREEKIASQRLELFKVGTPIFLKGKLVGFEKDKMSVPLEGLDIKSLSALEQAGIISFKEQKIDPAFIPTDTILQQTKALSTPSGSTIQDQPGIRRRVRDFFFTKPDISTEALRDRGFIGKGFEFFKFGVFQPVAGISQELKESGAKIKTESFRGSVALGSTIGAIGGLIPETPAGQIGTIGAFKLLSVAPPLINTGVGAFIGVTGVRGVFDTSSSPEERIGSGIIGALGIAGAIGEIGPFVSGATARLSTRFKGVKQGEVKIGDKKIDTKFIGDLAFDKGKGQIGLIPEAIGKHQGGFPAGAGALERGGFGFKLSEQIKGFSAKELRLTTSQRGLKINEGEFKVDPAVSDLGFFFTPADPVTRIPQTRISRLGLQDFFTRRKGDVSLSLTGGGRSQIILTEPVPLVTTGRTGTGGSGRISPKGSTELEVTALSNIEVLKDLGVTSIKGQRVDIILGRLSGKPVTTTGKPRFSNIISSTSSKTTTPISSVLGGTSRLSGFITNLTSRTSSPTKGISRGQGGSFPTTSLGSPSLVSSPVTRRGVSGGISPPIKTQTTTNLGSQTIGFVSARPSKIGKRKKDKETKKPKKKKKKGSRKTIRVAPSFTAITLDLRGKFPEVKPGLGINPSKIRVLPRKNPTPKIKKR